MGKIVILRGVSGSGKSTYAQKLHDEQGYEIVSRDALRLELLGKGELEKYFENGMDYFLEEYITTKETRKLVGLIRKGHNVVIDNTHIKLAYIQSLINLFSDLDVCPADVSIEEFVVTREVARERCDKRDKKPISDAVLNRQLSEFKPGMTINDFITYEDGTLKWVTKAVNRRGDKVLNEPYVGRKWYVPDFDTEPAVHDGHKPLAVICDLDGTSSMRCLLEYPYPHMRSYYSYKYVYLDQPDPLVKLIIQALLGQGVEVIFVSGRKQWDYGTEKNNPREYIDVYDLTKKFIEDKLGVSDPILYMRNPERHVDSEGKDLRDDLVKYKIFKEEIEPKWNVIGAIDDRKRVLAMWEDIGIKTLNVGSLNEEY